MKALAIDVETTGLDTKHDRVIQYGSCNSNGSQSDILINPGIPVPKDILEKTGLDPAAIADAPAFGDVADAIADELREARVWVGYNLLAFDLPILHYEFKRCAVAMPAPPDVLDVMMVVREYFPSKLVEVAKWFDIDLGDAAHNAAADATATLAVAAKFGTKLDKGFRELIDYARGVYLDSRRRFYKNESGSVCIAFGKHIGTPVKQLPPSYKRWLWDKAVTDREGRAVLTSAQ